MKICLVSKDGNAEISFEYYTNDVAHLGQLAKKSDLYELYSKLIRVGSKIREVNKNEVFEKERQAIHTSKLSEN